MYIHAYSHTIQLPKLFAGYGHDILAYTSCVNGSMLNWSCNRHKADGTGYGSIDTQGSERKGIRPKICWQVEWGQ